MQGHSLIALPAGLTMEEVLQQDDLPGMDIVSSCGGYRLGIVFRFWLHSRRLSSPEEKQWPTGHRLLAGTPGQSPSASPRLGEADNTQGRLSSPGGREVKPFSQGEMGHAGTPALEPMTSHSSTPRGNMRYSTGLA